MNVRTLGNTYNKYSNSEIDQKVSEFKNQLIDLLNMVGIPFDIKALNYLLTAYPNSKLSQ